uniref:Si:ch73-314g15.3 n=1 Tax=Latimeria chalumnae TaxID=7897 RepID=H3BB04_LATCH
QNQVYDVQVCNGKVYVQVQSLLSLTPIKLPFIQHLGKLTLTNVPLSSSETTLCYWAAKILCMPDPEEKVRTTREVQEWWNSGKITEIGQAEAPACPRRKENLTVLEPGRIKRGKGGTLVSQYNIFLNAKGTVLALLLDISWELYILQSSGVVINLATLQLDFYGSDSAWGTARHYRLLEKRLTELGSFFGALPVHNGLWQSATDTSHDLLARLAIVHMVHEARGLDVHPQTLARFAAQGDETSVNVLEVIYKDEITHVAAGLRWFTYICGKERKDCLSTFHELVRLHFKGYLKPPFNTEGRKTAGMTEEWYLPLVKPSQ